MSNDDKMELLKIASELTSQTLQSPKTVHSPGCGRGHAPDVVKIFEDCYAAVEKKFLGSSE